MFDELLDFAKALACFFLVATFGWVLWNSAFTQQVTYQQALVLLWIYVMIRDGTGTHGR